MSQHFFLLVISAPWSCEYLHWEDGHVSSELNYDMSNGNTQVSKSTLSIP